MHSADLLLDAFDRIRGVVHSAVEGLTLEQLAFRPGQDANSVAWLIWHLSRIQDDHVAAAAHTGQVWVGGGWIERYGLPFDPTSTGYGHSSDQVAALGGLSGELLTGYHDAVHQQTVRYVGPLTDGDLDRIVDPSWNPPVTLGARLISVITDDLQHAGQAAYVRGLGQVG